MALPGCNLSRGQKKIGFYEAGLSFNRGQMNREVKIGDGGLGVLNIRGFQSQFSSRRNVVAGREKPGRELTLIDITPGGGSSGRAQVQAHLKALKIARIASKIKYQRGWRGK